MIVSEQPLASSPKWRGSTTNAGALRSENTRMMRLVDFAQQHTGAVGAGATGGFSLIGFAAQALPLLQALSFLMGILVGIATICWYGYQAKHLKKKQGG
jgi:hypothetical protein